MPGSAAAGAGPAARMRALSFDYVDHVRLCVLRAVLTARFGRGAVGRADDFASREQAARVLHIVHTRELVLKAHQRARKTWKVPRGYPSTAAFVSTEVLIYDIDHVAARYMRLAIERARLVGLVE